MSEVPGRLAALIRGGMDSVKLVLAEGARAQVSTAAVCAATLRNVFFECFTAFSMAMDKVRAASRHAVSLHGSRSSRKFTFGHGNITSARALRC